jgi:hypothetical protein
MWLKSFEQIMAEFVERYGLEGLDEKDKQSVGRLAVDLAGQGWGKTAAFFGSKHEDQTKIFYLSALVEQNFLILRQLARLNKNLEALKQ